MLSLEEKEVVTTNNLIIRKMVQNAFSNEKISSSDMSKYNSSRQRNKEPNNIAR